ncbi:MAG: Na+/H+ antiporter NhaC family protein [Cellulosilyticum sp.]|nr:Na+/H+ antiporter NhaC family protein [Cellulosilyticum sp.]
MKKENKKGNPFALIPLGVFLVLFLGVGIGTKDFYKMPVIVAFLASTAVALVLNRKESLNKKLEVFCEGAGQSDIMMMCLIFILAGAFSNVAKAMGGVDATVSLSLSFIPSQFLVVGMFLIACFISVSMGTSVGTITALAPIGLGIAQTTGISVAMITGAIIGGSMFGDNLSMISDTTITATRTQGCELKDKFKVNFLIILPAAIITVILLVFMTSGHQVEVKEAYTFEWIKVVPYVAVLIGALAGVNVFILLASGTVLAALVGMMTGSFDVFGAVDAASSGMLGMAEMVILSMIIGGTLELIKRNGGIEFLLNFIKERIHSKKGAEVGIAMLVGLVDICTANNTIAIVMTGPLAKDIAEEYEIDPRRTASILDIFAASVQGIIPYGAQLLAAAGLVGISPMEIIRYLHYPILMAICGLIAIAIGFPNIKAKLK